MKPIPSVPWLMTEAIVSFGFSFSLPIHKADISSGTAWRRRSLKLHALVQLACGHFEHTIQLGKEPGDALFLSSMFMHSMPRRTMLMVEKEMLPRPMEVFGPKRFSEYTGTASHGSNFMLVAFRVIGFPVLALVEGGVQVQEVREETPCRHLAGQLVEVVVAVFRQVAHTPFLFPYLDGEDGGFSVSYP